MTAEIQPLAAASAYTASPMHRLLPLPRGASLAVLALFATPALAQETVVPTANVRTDYAQVLRVEPVYQTLRATRMEQQCDDPPAPATTHRGLSRIVGAMKEALKKDKPAADPATPGSCRSVPVAREFKRTIAYDVDYMYKGMKYRSRLASDPGNRLRVRVSVTPYVAPSDR